MKKDRQSTIDALNRFYQRDADKLNPKPKEARVRNKKPEKDVEHDCLMWMRSQGWTVNIYESKAVWNAKAENWAQSGMKFGTCDCMGNTGEGISVAIEFKAPGALSTFNSEKRYLQRKFIIDRINTNAFACVTDSVERLETIYTKWAELKEIDKARAREFLLLSLPQVSAKTRLKDEKLFDDE